MEISFESEADNEKTKAEINKWLAAGGVQCDEHQEWSDFRASAKTGIPTGVDMPAPAPTPTATVKCEAERAIHPDFLRSQIRRAPHNGGENVQKVIQ